MYERTVDSARVTDVRVGDVLDVRYDGDRGWWVWWDETRLGRLTWSMSSFEPREWRESLPRIDEGTMQIIRLVLDENARVVNAGGIVRPLGVPIPPISQAVPAAQVYVPTLRATIGADGDVTVQAENVPGSARVGSDPSPDARPKKTFWSRLTGRHSRP
ncbi:hypothetical protein [Microbacterium caowuchunii]|nr:hypothetical protein [Microbacterium caowuchunii]